MNNMTIVQPGLPSVSQTMAGPANQCNGEAASGAYLRARGDSTLDRGDSTQDSSIQDSTRDRVASTPDRGDSTPAGPDRGDSGYSPDRGCSGDMVESQYQYSKLQLSR